MVNVPILDTNLRHDQLLSSKSYDKWRDVLSRSRVDLDHVKRVHGRVFNPWLARLYLAYVSSADSGASWRELRYCWKGAYCNVGRPAEHLYNTYSVEISGPSDGVVKLAIGSYLYVFAEYDPFSASCWKTLKWEGDSWTQRLKVVIAETFFGVRLRSDGSLDPLPSAFPSLCTISEKEAISYLRSRERIDFTFLLYRHQLGLWGDLELSYVSENWSLAKDYSTDPDQFHTLVDFFARNLYGRGPLATTWLYATCLRLLRWRGYTGVTYSDWVLTLRSVTESGNPDMHCIRYGFEKVSCGRPLDSGMTFEYRHKFGCWTSRDLANDKMSKIPFLMLFPWVMGSKYPLEDEGLLEQESKLKLEEGDSHE